MGEDKKTGKKCIFDKYDLKFGMKKEDVSAAVEFSAGGLVGERNLAALGAELIQLFFDHEDRLWQVKAEYQVSNEAEAEEILDRMSKDYRFQTPSSRVAFELSDPEDGVAILSIRYSEANMKRIYLHRMMALGAEKLAKEKGKEKAAPEDDDEYIPTGPLIF
ncbi:MAG: hypothetical protein ACYDFU_04820 [Nitrospirota bacterium]